MPSVDFESLANFIIKLFSTVENSFNLFIDCTLTNLRNEPPLPWIHTLFSRWPTNGPSLKKIYLFSPTLLSAHSLKRILSQFEGMCIISHKYIFYLLFSRFSLVYRPQAMETCCATFSSSGVRSTF